MSSFGLCYEIRSTESMGNILVATRDINKGVELIIKDEKPLVWNQLQKDGKKIYHPNCSNCGAIIGSCLFKYINADLKDFPSEKSESIMEVLNDTMAKLNVSPSSNESILSITCKNECGAIYCNEECLSTANSSGHLFNCKHSELKINELRNLDLRGHFGLALKFYSLIANSLSFGLNDNLKDKKHEFATVSLMNFESMLANYHSVDFTRTIHAHRTGMIDVDQNMFENLLFPAYFSSHLEYPLQIIKDIFLLCSDQIVWEKDINDQTSTFNYSQDFVNSPIFSDLNFSKLMGTFAVNCLSVYIPSPSVLLSFSL